MAARLQTSSDPSTTSSDHNAMEREWRLISAIMAGVVEMRGHAGEHLPKFEQESGEEYHRRSSTAPWRPEFMNILQTLASKPFSRDVAIKGVAPDSIVGELDVPTGMRLGGYVDDIDGRGSSLTTFVREAFLKGIAKGAHAIMVDYSTTVQLRSRQDEIDAGARPYCVQVAVENILALYTEVIAGREEIVHVRITENLVERDGFGEKTTRRIRVMEPGIWMLYEYQQDGTWLVIDEGQFPRGGRPGGVPIVLFFTGERTGQFKVRPPLGDLAQLQIELWNALSRQEEILTYAGAPMLAANGLAAPTKGERIEVGPKTILFAPPVGDGVKTSFEYVQPAAANIAEIRQHVESIQRDMRRIGMQPLTEQPGNPSATGQSIAAAKAHSQVKAWALMLNDVIEQAFVYTCEYLKVPATIQTEISTDFSVIPYAQFPLQALTTARENRDISRKAFLDNLMRFDVLAADFDQKADAAQLKAEADPAPSPTMSRSPSSPTPGRVPSNGARRAKPVADGPPAGVNHSSKCIKTGLKRMLRAGEELAFSVVDDDGEKHASHTLRMDRGRYRVRCGAAGEDIEEGFATMAAAQRAGFAASRERLGHIL